MPNFSQRQSPRLRPASTRASRSQTPDPALTPVQLAPANPLATPPGGPSEPAATPPGGSSAARAIRIAPRSQPQLRIASFNTPGANVPLFGSLNVKDAIFYCKATVTQLKTIVGSAPQHFRSQIPPNPTKDILVNAVLSMRQEEAINSRRNQRTPNESLRELMSLEPNQVKSLAATDHTLLRELMSGALQADPNMEPGQVPESSHDLAFVVMTWQLQAHKAARATQDDIAPPPPQDREPTPGARAGPAPNEVPTAGLVGASANQRAPSQPSPANNPVAVPAAMPQASNLPTALNEIMNWLQPQNQAGTSARKDAGSDEEDWNRTGKRPKLQLHTNGFTVGSAANIEQVLKHYPGKGISSPSLACKELLGPFVLVTFIQGGNNVPTFLQDFKHWRKTFNGMPPQSQMEAHTLGRIIHMEMLMHDSPREALENRPSLEIALRRLFAILYVEEAVNTGVFRERTSAWQFVHFLHESIPMGTVMCDHIDDAMTARMTQQKKRLSAVKALEDARTNRTNTPSNPRNQNHRGNRRQDRQERHDQQEGRDHHHRQDRQ